MLAASTSTATFKSLFEMANMDGDDQTAPPAANRIQNGKGPDIERFKNEIVQLYWNEDRELPEVMKIMETKHNFNAK